VPNFDEIFSTNQERPVKYKEKALIRCDDFPFEDGDHFLVTFEKTNSEWRQGVALDLFGFFEINGKSYQDRIALWEDASQKETIITVFKEKSNRHKSKRLPKEGVLGINNIWDAGNGTGSWYGGAAMIVEEIENGRRYRCNDGHPDENFDDIIFTVQKIT
jgi:hypothetical protein